MPSAFLIEDYQAIFERLLAQLKIALNIKEIPYDIKGNRLRLFLDTVKANHYEVCFREKYLEIGLHFESSLDQNQKRLNAFQDHKKEIITAMRMSVLFGKLENQDRRRVWMEIPNPKADEYRVNNEGEFQQLVHRFIQVTWSYLKTIS